MISLYTTAGRGADISIGGYYESGYYDYIVGISTIVGYKLIKNVPSLLHTPLMSGMNALSGITILGALSATGAAVAPKPDFGFYCGFLSHVKYIRRFRSDP